MDKHTRNGLPTGYTLDGYRIEREIAAGGFGVTYLAQQLAFERKVAIKEYLPAEVAMRSHDGIAVEPSSSRDIDAFEHGLARFREEGKTLVRFAHPNIVAAHDFREANRTAYLVMQFVEGQNLFELLRERGPLPEHRLREILLLLLDGVEQVHRLGFLHRDIKPSNVIIRPDSMPVLVDFGAARRVWNTGGENPTSIVSSGYAPIEQYSGDAKQGPWTDIYALGATLYHAVTGAPPHDAVARVANDSLTPAVEAASGRYSAAFLAAIDRALARSAADRPQSIAEFRATLKGSAEKALPSRTPRAAADSARISTSSVSPPRRKALAAFVRAAPAPNIVRSKASPMQSQRWRTGSFSDWPPLRFALLNLAATVLMGAAYLQGWVERIFNSDRTGLTVVISLLFLGGLALSGIKFWALTRDLDCLLYHLDDRCRRTRTTRYLRSIARHSAGSRAIIATALRASVVGGIAVVRHIAVALISIGLIGTTVGFIAALNSVDLSGAASASSVSARVAQLVDGMSLALYSTLAGGVLSLWLAANYILLNRVSMRFVTVLVTVGESHARPMVNELNPRKATHTVISA